MTTVKKGFSHESQKNVSVDWYTPKWIFDELNLEFDLDPCSPIGGISWIPTKKYFALPESDGMKLSWEGRVWLNPPYGKETKGFLEKMHGHRNGVALVFARTDCAWFHDFVAKADAILFLRGRVKFVDGLGATGGSGAGSGSMLIAWGEDNVAALQRMSSFGKLVRL